RPTLKVALSVCHSFAYCGSFARYGLMMRPVNDSRGRATVVADRPILDQDQRVAICDLQPEVEVYPPPGVEDVLVALVVEPLVEAWFEPPPAVPDADDAAAPSPPPGVVELLPAAGRRG